MIKKLVIGGAAAGLLATLLFGRDAFSYLSTSVGWVKGSVKNSVPIEFEIERARNMIQELGPDIRNNMHAIAEEEVQVERLRERIGGLEGKLKPRQKLDMVITRANGRKQTVKLQSRIDTQDEVEYFQNGGILQFVLRQLAA